ncbi:MAG: hypothetical protein ACLQNE_31985 [Thermoguttaceae bacterium]|jgi:hypothetical protein
MNATKRYDLHLDGHLFRVQRELLLKIADHARRKQPYEPVPGDENLLDGLVELTDEIADQAHDRHGIECLLEDGEG